NRQSVRCENDQTMQRLHARLLDAQIAPRARANRRFPGQHLQRLSIDPEPQMNAAWPAARFGRRGSLAVEELHGKCLQNRVAWAPSAHHARSVLWGTDCRYKHVPCPQWTVKVGCWHRSKQLAPHNPKTSAGRFTTDVPITDRRKAASRLAEVTNSR